MKQQIRTTTPNMFMRPASEKRKNSVGLICWSKTTRGNKLNSAPWFWIQEVQMKRLVCKNINKDSCYIPKQLLYVKPKSQEKDEILIALCSFSTHIVFRRQPVKCRRWIDVSCFRFYDIRLFKLFNNIRNMCLWTSFEYVSMKEMSS